jgi:transcriptional regulator with XRE-family HTH domain
MQRAKRPVSLRVNSFVVWEYLTKKNLAQYELAKRLGICSSYMAQLMNGSRSPSPKLRRKMLSILSPLSFEELFLLSNREDRSEKQSTTLPKVP